VLVVRDWLLVVGESTNDIQRNVIIRQLIRDHQA
jgi:hypothetical protein